MKLKYILCMLLAIPFLWSCNNEDDIEDIFTSGAWYVSDYYTRANWNKGDGMPKYFVMINSDKQEEKKEGQKAMEAIATFFLAFKADGTFTGNVQNGTIAGNWQADGKKRTVRIVFTEKPATLSVYSKEFVNALSNAVFYQGDSNVLLLAPEDKKSYIQLGHKK